MNKDYIFKNISAIELLKSLPDNSVDMILTDPPYELDAVSGGGCINKKSNPIKDRIGYISNGFDYELHFLEFNRVLKKGTIAIFCSNKQVSDIMKYWQDKKYMVTLLVWHKYNAIPSINNKYMPDIEFIVLARLQGSTFNNIGVKEQSKVFTYPFPSNAGRIHPTEKPIDLIRRLLRIHTNENDLVLDCFAGSFTTAIACYEEGRKFTGSDIDADMFNKAFARFNNTINQLKLF